MGTVHKFRRPPKNKRQFQSQSSHPIDGAGDRKRRWLGLRILPASVVAWLALLLVAVGIWAVGALLAGR